MPKADPEPVMQLATRIPKRLRYALKIAAIEEEKTMAELVVEALREKLERDT